MKITPPKDEAYVMKLTRLKSKRDKFVYLLVVNKPLSYKSRIIYIGTTKKGVFRIGQSIIERGLKAVKRHGIKTVEAYVVSCKPRNKVAIWKKLESAFLLAFRREYGVVPTYNSKFKKKRVTDEFEYFNEKTISSILKKFDK